MQVGTSPQFFGVALFGSTLQAAVLGRAGPGERFLAVPRQAESPLSPRGVYFIIRRSERLERTRRREGFDAAPPHGRRLFLGRKLGVPRNINQFDFFIRNSLPNLTCFNHPLQLQLSLGGDSEHDGHFQPFCAL